MNQVNLIGRLTKDADVSVTKGGKKWARFTLAVNKGKDKPALFVDCTAWEKTADLVSQYFATGSQIGVTGELDQSEYQDKEGKNQRRTYVTVRQVYFIDSKSYSKPSNPAQAPIPDFDTGPTLDINIDDLPF